VTLTRAVLDICADRLCVAGALLTEVYLGGAVLLGESRSAWGVAGLAGIAAVGQLADKTLFYLAGRGALRLPRLFGTPPT